MTQKQLLDIFKETGSILDGHFVLSSGFHSPQYLQCARVLSYPKHASSLCNLLAEKFKDRKPDIVIAPALGGIIVSHEVARALGAESLFTERVEGKMVLRRGFRLKEKDRVLVVEDVVTTGLSTNEVIEVVRYAGAKLAGVGCLIDRSKGNVNFAPRFESLIKIDIPLFNSENCPLCKNKVPITKPGSR